MTTLAPEAASYLHDLDRALVGPRRVKAGLIREADDHLTDASEAYLEAGYDADAAVARAVDDFGPVDEIAAAFQTTLAVAASRRTAWILLGALAIQPFLWDGGLNLSERHRPTADAQPGLAFLDMAIEVLGGMVMVGAVLAILGTGIGNRWFRAGRTIARVTAVFTLAACALVTSTAVSMVLLAGTSTLLIAWVLLAAGLFLPLACAVRSARLCLRAC